MLTDIQVFQALENALPSELRSVVARRIRRVNGLWPALHEEAFLKKAASFAGADPDRWRPGLLGLLLASETDYLRARFGEWRLIPRQDSGNQPDPCAGRLAGDRREQCAVLGSGRARGDRPGREARKRQ